MADLCCYVGGNMSTLKSPDGAVGSDKEKGNVDDVELLKEHLGQSLSLKEQPQSKLEELTLAGIAKYLASDQCKHVITMAGAGISTSAGIPDFRSPGSGLYDNLASYDLPHPQAIFEIGFFKENPKPFFVLAKELYPVDLKPTLCHYFIKLLSDKGKLLRHYTQNIDTLERISGLPVSKFVEAHGSFNSSTCLSCGKTYDLEWMKDKIFADQIPVCDVQYCAGVIKPDIVFFGEALPKNFTECVKKDFKMCDLLIVMGTSLTVQPFASLVGRVPADTPRLYINLEKGPSCGHPLLAQFSGDFNFDEDKYRDVFKKATCDDGCQELADLLNWGEELKNLVQTGHSKIDEAKAARKDNSGSQESVQKKQKSHKGKI